MNEPERRLNEHKETRDFYSDTDLRMRHDPEFRAAVNLVAHLAMRHGFTPGELKQIAFRAAYEVEMRNPPCASR